VELKRLGDATLAQQAAGEVVVGCDVVGVDLECGALDRDRLIEVLQIGEREAEIVHRSDEGRLELHGALEMPDGLLEAASLAGAAAEHVVGFGHFAAEADSFLEFGLGLVLARKAAERGAECVVQRGGFGELLQQFPENGDAFFVATGGEQDFGEEVDVGPVLRVTGDGAPETGQRFLGVTELPLGEAEEEVYLGIVGKMLERFGETMERLGAAAGEVQRLAKVEAEGGLGGEPKCPLIERNRCCWRSVCSMR
jgi:hypothetical protein